MRPEHAAEEQQRRDGSEHELEVRQLAVGKWNGMSGVGGRNRLSLFTDAVGDAARFADEVLEEVLEPVPRPVSWVWTPLLHTTSEGRRAEAHLVVPEHPGNEHE